MSVVFVVCCLIATTSWAIEQLQLTIGHWQSDDIKLEKLDLNVSYTQRGIMFTATADELLIPSPLEKLTALRLDCKEMQFFAEQMHCQKGRLQFEQKDLGIQQIDFTIKTDTQRQSYRVETSGLTIADAKINMSLSLEEEHWWLKAESNDVDIAILMTFIQRYLTRQQQQVLLNWQHAGKMGVKLEANGIKDQLNQVALKSRVKQLDLSDELGQFVTEGLQADWALYLKHRQQVWQWQTDVALAQGQAYADPVFLDFLATPISLKAKGNWHQKKNKLEVVKSEINHQDVGIANLSLTMKHQQLHKLKLDIAETNLAPIYQHWIQPFTVGMATDDLAINGKASLNYYQEQAGYTLQLGLDGISAQDGAKRFEVHGAKGELAWTTLNEVLPVNLVWQQATLYSIPIGHSALIAQTEKARLKLLKPWQIPILDGELKINDFALSRQESEGISWTFEGLLTPISMTTLSQHLDWPPLHGKLSGVIPKVAYQSQEINVDGALMVKLFKGTTIIHDLRLTELFGTAPQLYSNIDLIGFDLETMTETFDFGKMTGTIEGKVQNLRLANWQPVAFDAYLKTEKHDKVRHRISQQAVNNLSELGGGASGALSRTVLRFFEDFSYQRLGLSCKLRNDVCEMGGVEEAEQGYYIVKGGGLPPRINVKGFTRRVDWPELVERLKAVSNNPSPVMQ
jgi:hypothetical protein